MSDWWALNSDSYEHFGNGCDMNILGGIKETGTMADGNWCKEIPNWIKQGYITKDRIDDVCRRIIVAINQIPDSVSDNDDYLNYVKL